MSKNKSLGSKEGVKEIEETYKEQYNAEEVIFLNVEFSTGKHPAAGLVTNEDYTYKAVFVKTDNNWILKEYGQG